MRQWKLLILLLMIAVKPVLAAEAGWGVWTDKEEKHAYAFLKNNEDIKAYGRPRKLTRGLKRYWQ